MIKPTTNTYPILSDTSRVAVWDIETELIPKSGPKGVNLIFCNHIKVNEDPIKRFTYLWHPTTQGNLKGANALINSCDFMVGHNIINFDITVVENKIGKLTPYPLDTLLIAKLMYTSDELFAMDIGIKDMPKALWGRYSLKAFGYRFKSNKIIFEQFDKMTDDMLSYCDQDVLLTYQLFQHLRGMTNFPSMETIHLENQVANIIKYQEQSGFYFDIESARKLYTEMKFEQGTIERRLKKRFRPMYLKDGPVKETNKLIKRKIFTEDTNYGINI